MTIAELKAKAVTVKNATAVHENTAPRVGELFENVIERLPAYYSNEDLVSDFLYINGAFTSGTDFKCIKTNKNGRKLIIFNGQPNNVEYLDSAGAYISGGDFANGKIKLVAAKFYEVNCDIANCKYIAINFVKTSNLFGADFKIEASESIGDFLWDKVIMSSYRRTDLLDDIVFVSGSTLIVSDFKSLLIKRIEYSKKIIIVNGQPNNVEYLDSNGAYISGGDFANGKINKIGYKYYEINCDVVNCVSVAINFVNTVNEYANIDVRFDQSNITGVGVELFNNYLFPHSNIISGKLYLNGSVEAIGDFSYSKLERNNEDKKVFVINGQPNNVEYLDSNGAYISGGDFANGKINKIGHKYYEINCDVVNCKYVAVNFVNSVNTYTDISVKFDNSVVSNEDFKFLSDVLTTNESVNNLENYTLSIIGDSIAAGAIVSNINLSFGHLVAKKLGMTANLATAKGGFAYGDVSGSANADIIAARGSDKGLYYYMIPNMTKNEKLFIFEAGTNDHGMSIPVGVPFTIITGVQTPSYDTQTMCGGMNQAIKNIYDTLGHINILVITPIQKNFYTQTVPYDFPCGRMVNSAGSTLSDYVDAIKLVAKFWNLPVLDMYQVNDMNPYLPDMYHKYFWEGIHPNELGHERMADLIYKYIINNLSIPVTYEGTIINNSSDPVQGAKVTVSHGNGNDFGVNGFEVYTDVNGFFRVTDIVRGKIFTVSISKIGYTTIYDSFDSNKNIIKSYTLQ